MDRSSYKMRKVLYLPAGLAMVIPGIGLLILGSRHIRHWIRHRRERNREINERIVDAEDKLPDGVSGVLKKTRPRQIAD